MTSKLTLLSLLHDASVCIHHPTWKTTHRDAHQQGGNCIMFYSTSAIMREIIRVNISFHQKVFLRPQAIVCPFQDTPNTSDFQCKQQMWIDRDGILGSRIYRLAHFNYPYLCAFFWPKTIQSWSQVYNSLMRLYLVSEYKCSFSYSKAQEKTLKQL